MNILFVVPYVPTPIRVRPYQFVRHLHARGHTLTVAALWGSAEEQRQLDALAELGMQTVGAPHTRGRALANCLRALPSRTPLQAAYCRSPGFEELLRRALHAPDGARPDAIHVEHLRGSPFLFALRPMLDTLPGSRPPLVWDSVDCISLLFAQAAQQSAARGTRLLARLELGRTRRHEGHLVHLADHTVVTAQGDADALRSLAAAADAGRSPCLSVVPNGVDTETFRPAPPANRAPARIVFSGKMSYHANATAALHLAREVMPRVWAAHPDAELWIVGKEPTAALTALANPEANTRRVVVTGEVPSMAAMLQQATIAAAPVVYGAGVQNKVLEAMACSTPVVASRRAASALEAQPGRDLLLADAPEDFAQQILALLAEPARCEALGAAGRAYVERRHSWDASAARLEAIYAA